MQDNPRILRIRALFLCTIPVLSVFGTYLVNFYQNNLLLLLWIGYTTFIVTLICLDRNFPKKLYPLAVLMLAIAILYHKSLITMYLWGTDIHVEHYFGKLVLANSKWEQYIPHLYNSALSVTILFPVFKILLGLGDVWIFKAVYPLIFSLVPLVLFQGYRKIMDEKGAFLATFFFMSFFAFFGEILQIAKQQVAGLFFALLMLLLVDEDMERRKKAILFIFFSFSLVVSHYSTAYLFIFYLLPWPIVLGLRRLVPSTRLKLETISSTVILLYFAFVFTWNIYTASSSPLDVFVYSGERMWNGICTEFFSPETKDPYVLYSLGGALRRESIPYEVYRVIQIVTQFLIVVGVLRSIAKPRENKFPLEYFTMVLTSTVILTMCMLIPYFASVLNATRIYHITLFLLAPFCILGFDAIFRWIRHGLRTLRLASLGSTIRPRLLTSLVLVVLIPYFLFTTGFMFEVVGDAPHSFALAMNRMDHPYYGEPEVSCVEWILSASDDKTVYGDNWGFYAIYGTMVSADLHMQIERVKRLPADTGQIQRGSLIFLRQWNVRYHEILISIKPKAWKMMKYVDLKNNSSFSNVINNGNKIYDNDGSQVYEL